MRRGCRDLLEMETDPAGRRKVGEGLHCGEGTLLLAERERGLAGHHRRAKPLSWGSECGGEGDSCTRIAC